MFKELQQSQEIPIQIGSHSLHVAPGTVLLDLAPQYGCGFASPIVGAKYNNEVVDLYTEIKEPGTIEYLDLTSEDGIRIYRQSLVFLLVKAAWELFPNRTILVEHSLGKSYYCEFKGYKTISPLDIIALEARMREIVAQDLPVIPEMMPKEKAIQILCAKGHEEKSAIVENMDWKQVRILTCGNYASYSHSVLAPRTGGLNVFQLQPYAQGFLLRFPAPHNPREVAPITDLPKLAQVFRESEEWAGILGINNLAGLNRLLAQNPNEGNCLIHIAEALHEKKIARIADEIYANRDKLRVVLIAGPSSSGKTTFAQRLLIQLRVHGLQPVSLSLDDYFVDREHTPRDENGEYDFEALEALDLELFNQQLQQLIAGQEVEIPTFNFLLGKREWRGKKLQVKPDHPLIIEGIHGLNEKLTASIKRENKYKIYISALTQISIDNHNRIPTTDTRLIRRIVRDNQFRSHDALATLKRWPSVRRGEEKNIFPYQEEADMMFNSALIYELGVFKKYAYPLLAKVTREEKEYADAQRLLTLLKHFPEIPDQHVPLNSILREFIGGSSFHE
ncbi:nucleoside kinase [Thermanaerosceptrum fracticalcis]|uniref:nucleoside kinase n=1 Tax=Thermanaerosceptrum fracticalcis TaxID=1712410 RepID=UPI000AEB97F6|nr:nucleoside kinase [Thermanaerosceptrum fracticalcis]